MPGHELSGVVAELGYGTTGLTVGQQVFGVSDWTRNGSLAEYVAVEARNLAPLPADGVGSIAVQLAREVGARVMGTGRAADRETALGLGVDDFVDTQADQLDDVGEVDLVFDVIGGDIRDRSAGLVRPGGTLVSIVSPVEVRPDDGRAIFFVVEPDRGRLTDLAQRVRDGRLKPIVGAVRTLPEAPAAFVPDRRTHGKTIIRITDTG